MAESKEEKRKFGVSMPEEVVQRLDQVAKDWYLDRSAAITRVFLEWEEIQLAEAKVKAQAV